MKTRTIAAQVRTVEDGERRVELAFSSETPCMMMWGLEILQHTKDAVRLDRLTTVGSLLYNHDPSDARNVVGRVISAEVNEDDKVCRAVVEFDDDERAELVYQKVQRGTIRGVSVGYAVNKYEDVPKGHTTSDGFAGPCVIARSWEPLEISFTPVPADPTVGPGRSIIQWGGNAPMNVKHKRSEDEDPKKDERLDEMEDEAAEDETSEDEQKDDESSRQDDETANDDEDDKERSVAAEKKRAVAIMDVCSAFGIDPREYIERGASIEAVNADIIKRQREGMTALPVSKSRAAIEINRDEREKFRAAAVDGLAMRAGLDVGRPADGAEEFRGISMFDLGRLVLERAGEHVSYSEDKRETAARAFTSGDFPLILSNLANKTLLSQYNAYPSTWQAWCSKGSLSDFKEAYGVRISDAPDLERVLEGGEYKMAEFQETASGYRLATYGKKFALTRQMIINDDLNAFTRIPSELGSAAARTVNRAVYALLSANGKMDDGVAMFHKDHGNLGTPGTLSTTALSEARKCMRRQRGLNEDNNNFLNLTPAFLIVPPELETLARQLLTSSTDISQVNPAMVNVFANSMDIIVEPNLTNETAWYLATRSVEMPTIEVAFLNGHASPTVEQQQGWNIDGIEYKVRLDFGVKAWDHRGLFKNAGA